MPKNKNGYKRPGYRACGSMVARDAAKALSIARGLKRLLNVEVKNFDVQQSAVAIADAPAIIQLSNIPQGDSTNQRDGSQCKMVSLELNFTLNQSASAVITHVRIMVVLDKQTNQAIYGAADLLEDVTIRDIIISPRNLDNKNRFQVLYDHVFSFSNSGRLGAVTKMHINKDIIFRYDASTPSIADLTQNSLSLLQVATEVTNDPSISMFSRLRFIDN